MCFTNNALVLNWKFKVTLWSQSLSGICRTGKFHLSWQVDLLAAGWEISKSIIYCFYFYLFFCKQHMYIFKIFPALGPRDLCHSLWQTRFVFFSCPQLEYDYRQAVKKAIPHLKTLDDELLIEGVGSFQKHNVFDADWAYIEELQKDISLQDDSDSVVSGRDISHTILPSIVTLKRPFQISIQFQTTIIVPQ